MPTKQEIAAALGTLRAVAETIKELGSAPRGVLYAALMSKGASMQQFEQIEHILVNSGLCRRAGNCLEWALADDDGAAELGGAVYLGGQASAPSIGL